MRLNNRAPRRGVAAVEFAVVLPIMLILVLGVWEIGRLVEVQQLLTNAAREGARRAAMGSASNTDAKNAVTRYLQNTGIPTTNATINVTNETNPGVDASDAAQLDCFRITISVPVADIGWLLSGQFFSASTVLTSEAVWYSMQNKDYPSPSDPPVDY